MIKEIIQLVHYFLSERRILKILIRRDFEGRYLSSIIGLPWAFIQPAVYVFVVWFAFTFGLKVSTTTSGLPYAPWLILGLIPWLFISQTMIVSAMSIFEYGYLIKKASIPIAMIPIIKIFSGMIVHIILMTLIIIIMILFYGIYPSVYWFQFIYYLFSMTVLLSGIAWFISSINVFIKDMAHIVNIVVTMLFWATPIIWPYSMLHGNLKYVALLNPFFYITEGYRYTFIENHWFFEFPEMNFFFWSFTLLIFILGAFTFNKLKPYFADVL
jgi:ABC-type polysaccharide/polyol phosphate export permease